MNSDCKQSTGELSRRQVLKTSLTGPAKTVKAN
jgi:hypothetical protein